MSLVNDMLRDLEARRAGPSERPQLDGLYAVDETAAFRRDRSERLRRNMIWFSSLCLIGLLVGMMIGRVVLDFKADDQPALPPASTLPAEAPLAAVRPQLLEILPQHDAQRFQLQLLLDQSVVYERTEENGAVSLLLKGVQIVGEPAKGRIQRAGSSLSWRVEAQGANVQILLVGMGDQLTVLDRLEAAGSHWQLWLEVPLSVAQVEVEAALPEAIEDVPQEQPMPDWATRQVDSSPNSSAVEAPAPPAAPARPAKMQVAAHTPDALSRARQSLMEQDYPLAISELEALHRRQGSNQEIVRLLARAYLEGGQQARLLAWLPGQLRLYPHDSELSVLLARAQLQAGDNVGAVATLSSHRPSLASDPNYYALLGASFQQTGQWQESAAIYQQLVSYSPSQGQWQLGLAIALEQAGKPLEAGRHYRLATQGTGLDDSARRFAEERGAALGEP
jgi:MSHA biogenesis protein MshN